jgi:glycine cleavage system H protein
MNIPDDLKYSKEHEWAKIENDVAVIGITDYAQGELGDIVYIELPEVGTVVSKDESLGTIEAVKAVSDIFSPLSGEVVQRNEKLNDVPEEVNKDPYNNGWMIKLKYSDASELDGLLDNKQYEELIQS